MSCERLSHKEAYVGIFLVADPEEGFFRTGIQHEVLAKSKMWINDSFSNKGASDAFFKLFFSLFVFLFSIGTIKLLFFSFKLAQQGEKVATMNTHQFKAG